MDESIHWRHDLCIGKARTRRAKCDRTRAVSASHEKPIYNAEAGQSVRRIGAAIPRDHSADQHEFAEPSKSADAVSGRRGIRTQHERMGQLLGIAISSGRSAGSSSSTASILGGYPHRTKSDVAIFRRHQLPGCADYLRPQRAAHAPNTGRSASCRRRGLSTQCIRLVESVRTFNTGTISSTGRTGTVWFLARPLVHTFGFVRPIASRGLSRSAALCERSRAITVRWRRQWFLGRSGSTGIDLAKFFTVYAGSADQLVGRRRYASSDVGSNSAAFCRHSSRIEYADLDWSWRCRGGTTGVHCPVGGVEEKFNASR